MTRASLRAVTLKTVANCTHAAERAVGAYRVGGHRLVAATQRNVDRAAQRSAGRVAPRLAEALVSASGRVGTLATQGVDVVSQGAERMIALGADGVTAQIERVAVLADGVDYPLVVSGLEAVARLSLPGAQVALALSQRVAEGADKLYAATGGQTARAKASRAKAAPARARRAAAKPAAQPVAQAVKRARRAAKPVESAVEAAVEAGAEAVVRSARRAVKAVARAVEPQPAARRAKPAAKPAVKPKAKPAARRAATAVKATAAPAAPANSDAPADATS